MNGASVVRINVNDAIYLSPIGSSDKRRLVELLNDREIYETTLRIPFPYTEADAEQFIQIASKAASKHGHPLHFAVRDNSDQLIGGCGFEGLAYGHRAEIGYWLAKSHWGRGIMTNVVRAACQFAMSDWKLVRITAHVFSFNDRSVRVLEKNDFHLEGILLKHHLKNGQFLDSKLFALVK